MEHSGSLATFEDTSEDHRIAGDCSRCWLEGQY